MGDDEEKNTDLDRIAFASTKGLAESVKEVHWAQPIVTDAKVKHRVTRLGRVVKPSRMLIESLEASAVDLQYLSSMAELDSI